MFLSKFKGLLMLTEGRQIAAARQLLGWSQADLAEKSGISKPSVIRMEKDLHSVKYDVLSHVQTAIEKYNIEFLPQNGVRENKQTLKKLTGQTGFRELYDDLYNTAKDIGGTLYLFNGISELVAKWLGKDYLEIHKNRMMPIKDNYQYHIIVKEGDEVFLGAQYCTYKWFPADLFNDKTFFIYGTKVAFITFTAQNVEIIILDQ